PGSFIHSFMGSELYIVLISTNNCGICFIGFPDHHDFNQDDIQKIIDLSNKTNATIVCTYKDYVKLRSHERMNETSWGYIPIEVSFLEGEKEFQETLKTRRGLHIMES
ncbi:MAG: tetraacyldisaccharide 4'-kinase, partial [Cyclobacteriaceae bacterium]